MFSTSPPTPLREWQILWGSTRSATMTTRQWWRRRQWWREVAAGTAPTAATHEIQVAVETSEDRRNRNETGWSPTLPGHNASPLLFLAESWNGKVARECCTAPWTTALDRTRNPRTSPRPMMGRISRREKSRYLPMTRENGRLISTRSLDWLIINEPSSAALLIAHRRWVIITKGGYFVSCRVIDRMNDRRAKSRCHFPRPTPRSRITRACD